MLTIKEVLLRTADFFNGKGIENPKLDAELLLAHGLGMTSRLDLYLQHDRPLEEAALEKIRPLVKRRAKGEPVQYIEGKANFMGVDFFVDGRVLIPRPETEELVEQIETLLDCEQVGRILDLGTGSGVLALTLSRMYEEAEIVATDVSGQALEVAHENAKTQQLDARVMFLESDWYKAVEGAFDLIVSNPPYLTKSELEEAEPQVKEWEPGLALVSGGENGEDCLFRVMEGAIGRLREGGLLALETGIAQREALEGKAKELGFREYWPEADLSGRDRFFFAKA